MFVEVAQYKFKTMMYKLYCVHGYIYTMNQHLSQATEGRVMNPRNLCMRRADMKVLMKWSEGVFLLEIIFCLDSMCIPAVLLFYVIYLYLS